MRIKVNADDYVDLEAPIYMEEDYQKKFVAFFEKMFPGEIKVIKVDEPERSYEEKGETKSHRWTPEDNILLLGSMDNNEIAEKLKVSEMAVTMKRGSFVPDFLAWMKKKGFKKPTIKIIGQYYKETEGKE